MRTITYSVPDISCSHCAHAIASEVRTVTGVASVDVDVRGRTVTVSGEPLDGPAIIAAIDEAGYEVAA